MHLVNFSSIPLPKITLLSKLVKWEKLPPFTKIKLLEELLISVAEIPKSEPKIKFVLLAIVLFILRREPKIIEPICLKEVKIGNSPSVIPILTPKIKLFFSMPFPLT